MKVNIYLLFIAINGLMAYWHNHLRIKAIKNGTKAIDHTLWAIIYCGICLVPLFWYNLWFTLSVLFLHLSIFPVVYNVFAGLPAFNLSQTTDSKIDQWMVRMGLKSTVIVNLSALALSIYFLYLSL